MTGAPVSYTHLDVYKRQIQGSDKVEIMELWDFFPDLFGREHEETEKKIQEKQLAEYKARFNDFAIRHNHARAGGGN